MKISKNFSRRRLKAEPTKHGRDTTFEPALAIRAKNHQGAEHGLREADDLGTGMVNKFVALSSEAGEIGSCLHNTERSEEALQHGYCAFLFPLLHPQS